MKQELRKKYLLIRKQLSPLRRNTAIKDLFEHLKELHTHFDGIGSFASTKEEIDLSAVNELLAKENRLFLPRVEGVVLQFYLVTDLQNQMVVKNKLMEPNPELCKKVNLTSRHLLLVPAIAFDCEHYRLGYGKGFYDRFLAEHPDIPTLGIGFCEQLSDQILPHDPWDRPVQNICLF